MRAGPRYLLVLVAAAALACTACNKEAETPDALTGVIVAVDPASGAPESFELEFEGDTAAIGIDPDIDYGFDLEHLREHMETRDPVKVTLRPGGGDLVATQIEDV